MTPKRYCNKKTKHGRLNIFANRCTVPFTDYEIDSPELLTAVNEEALCSADLTQKNCCHETKWPSLCLHISRWELGWHFGMTWKKVISTPKLKWPKRQQKRKCDFRSTLLTVDNWEAAFFWNEKFDSISKLIYNSLRNLRKEKNRKMIHSSSYSSSSFF